MTSDVSEVTKTDEDVLILNVPDRVTSSETLNVLVRAAIAAFGIAGIIVSIVAALAHVPAAQERSCCVRGCCEAAPFIQIGRFAILLAIRRASSQLA
jgi:hypothetical protein